MLEGDGDMDVEHFLKSFPVIFPENGGMDSHSLSY